jgi:hypothetical protein
MQDLRIMCGSDVRQSGVWPEDATRAEGLAARYGGTVSLYPVGTAAVCVEWRAADGQVHVHTGTTAGDALQQLAEHLA